MDAESKTKLNLKNILDATFSEKSLSKAFSGIAASSAGLGLLLTMGLVMGDKTNLDIFKQNPVKVEQDRNYAKINQQIAKLRWDIIYLEKGQIRLSQMPTEDRAAVEIATLALRLEAFERRQARLEQAILNSPEKALALPLIRRDIDNVRDSNIQSISGIKQSVDQVYDLTKWLLGSLAVGVFSLAIANFLSKK